MHEIEACLHVVDPIKCIVDCTQMHNVADPNALSQTDSYLLVVHDHILRRSNNNKY